MELRHLRYFVRVAEEMHFGRAAQQLGISQPPLSQQIRALEEEIGVQLFDRTSRRVDLTEAGRIFLPEARQTLRLAEHAVESARRADRGEIGELSIGFTASTPFVPVMASALFRYRQTYPNVHMNLSEMPRSGQIAGLESRELDIGVMRGFEPPLLPEALVPTVIYEEPLMVAMRRDHPLAACSAPLRVADLKGEAFVLYEHPMGVGFNEHLRLLCRNAGFAPRVEQEARGLGTLLGLVAAGFGLTVMAQSLGALHPDNVTYRPIDQPNAISRLWFVHHMRMSSTCRRFAESLGILA